MSSPLQNASKIASTAAVSQRPIRLDKLLEVSFEPKEADDPVRKPDAKEVTDYIVREMIANTSRQNADFVRVKDLFQEFKSSTAAPALRVTALIRALYEFFKLVKGEAKWDHKNFILGTWGKVSQLYGAEIRYDVWSNVHYGFVGRQMGFNSEVLLTAAGYVHAASNKLPRGWFERWVNGQAPYLGQVLDDPADQAAITLGMQLSDTRARELQSSDVIALLKQFLPQISRK